jgi:integrase
MQVANGYQRTGLGMDPTLAGQTNDDGNEADTIENRGWRDWENVVWYFENCMNCKAVAHTQVWFEHREFFSGSRKHGHLAKIYKKLGVSVQIDIHLIAPLAIKLCWETGLNTETLLGLRRDCFQEDHPLTGLPYLRYYKARSTGEKDLHLSVLDDPKQTALTLEYKQSTVIRRTIELITKLTEPLVERAAPEDKPYLFLYEPRTPGLRDTIVRLNVQSFHQWARGCQRQIQKQNEAALPEVFTLGRFRPTKIIELARQGKDLLDIQVVSGHSTASTTLRYLASHQIAPVAQKEVAAALQKIHENKQEFKKHPKPYAMAASSGKPGDVIYKAILCDCKDVFNPPANIKKVMSHKEGQSCSFFNMCLTCPNALVLKRHLPRLVAYKREIETVRSNNLAKAPNSAHYDKSLAVINGVFLEFTQEELDWAEQKAQQSDYHSDPLTHRPVSEEIT